MLPERQLKSRDEKRKLTQKELVEQINVSDKTISMGDGKRPSGCVGD